MSIYPCAASLWEHFLTSSQMLIFCILYEFQQAAGNNIRVFLTLQPSVSTKAKANIHLFSKLSVERVSRNLQRNVSELVKYLSGWKGFQFLLFLVVYLSTCLIFCE